MNRDDRSRLLSLPCGRVYVRDCGPLTGTSLPPLLAVHGLLVTSHSFRQVIGPLAEQRRVIAIDLPGCGESDRPAPADAGQYAVPWLAERVAEVAAHLELNSFDLLAHSFGGTVALCLAADRPELVRRLVVADPVAFPMELPLEGRVALMPRLGPYMFKTLYRRADLRRYLRRGFSTPELLDETALNVYWDRLSRDGGREAAYEMLGHLITLPWLRHRLPDIAAPTLVIWGDRDALMPLADGERLVQLVSQASLELVQGCGHAVPEERPDRLVELTTRFCE